jgi:hypothetical protein
VHEKSTPIAGLQPDIAVDVESEYAQVVIEAIHSNDVLQHIPIAKTAVAAVAVIRGVRDYIPLKKLTRFLEGLADLSKWQRDDMVSRIEADPAYGRRVGNHVIELLDRVDSHRKPMMVAAVFAAFARGEIQTDSLNRLNAAIEALPAFAIDFVRTFKNAQPGPAVARLDRELLHVMSNAGLATQEARADGLAFLPNSTSNAFVTLNLDGKSRPHQ